MKHNLIILGLLTTLFSLTASGYPEDNYAFNRTGNADLFITKPISTPTAVFLIKAGRLVPLDVGKGEEGGVDDMATFNLPEAARENVVKVCTDEEFDEIVALRRDGRVLYWGHFASENSDGVYSTAPLLTRNDVRDIVILPGKKPYLLLEEGSVVQFTGEQDPAFETLPLPPEITAPVALVGEWSQLTVIDASGIARFLVPPTVASLDQYVEDLLHSLTNVATIKDTIALHHDGTATALHFRFKDYFQPLLDTIAAEGKRILDVATDGDTMMVIVDDGQLRGVNLNAAESAIPLDLQGNGWKIVENEGFYALDREGIVYHWGSGDAGAAAGPVSNFANSPLVGVAFGNSHGVVVRGDGTVRGWGDDSHQQASGLNTVTNAIAVAAAADYSIALLADGTVVGAGLDTHRQLADLYTLTDIVDMAAGDQHILATRRDGTVVGTGNDADNRISGLAAYTQVLDIDAGHDHSIIRYGPGEIACAGNNSRGQCNIPTNVTNFNRLADGRVLDIAAGHQTSAATVHNLAANPDLDEYDNEGNNSLGNSTYGALYLWGAHNAEHLTHHDADGTDTGDAVFRSVALANSHQKPALRLSHFTKDGKLLSSPYWGAFVNSPRNINNLPLAIATSYAHLIAAGGNFIGANFYNDLYVEYAGSSPATVIQSSVLNIPSYIYELASDVLPTPSSVVKMSEAKFYLDWTDYGGERYLLQFNTNLSDEEAWQPLPNNANSLFIRAIKQ